MHLLRWLTVFCLSATAAAQYPIQTSGCTNQVGANQNTISCTDTSVPNLTDNYFVTLKVYDNHSLGLDCGGCGRITPFQGMPIASPQGYNYYAWLIDHLNTSLANTEPTFTVTSSAFPSTWILAVIRVTGTATIDTNNAVISGGTTMSNTLTTDAAGTPVYGWCAIDHNDALTPGNGFARIGPTTYQNNLFEYAILQSAGSNAVTCKTPYSDASGAVTAWALVPTGAAAPAPMFDLKIVGSTMPSSAALSLKPSAFPANPCGGIVTSDGTSTHNGVYINYCIYPMTQAAPTPAPFPYAPVTNGPAFTITYSNATANITNTVTLNSANPTYQTVQTDSFDGYYLLFNAQTTNTGPGTPTYPSPGKGKK